MVLPYTMSRNVMTVWVLVLFSTYRVTFPERVVLLMQYYYLCATFEGKDVLPTASKGFARCCRQASGLGCTETKLLLMVL